MLEGIPSEVIVRTLHYCEYPTILRFASTCKAYHELVNRSTSLQLHIELEASGLELVKGASKPDATYTQILEDLRQFHDAWFNLSFGRPIVRWLSGSQGDGWELREGFFINSIKPSPSASDPQHGVQFIPLDANSPDPPPVIFGSTFDRFTADPAQGLVAIMSIDDDTPPKIYIQLCSSATGLAHPLAQYPKLTAELDLSILQYPTPSESAIEIMGDLVLIRVSDTMVRAYEVLIWNWKSGIFRTRISSSEGICDQLFLDRQHLILQVATNSSHSYLDTLALLVYAIPDADSPHNDFPDGYLKVIDSVVSQPILRLEFPRIKESYWIPVERFSLQSDPVPGRILYTKSAAFAYSYATTLCMIFDCFPTGATLSIPHYRIFLDGKFLVDLIRTNTHLHAEARSIPWNSWGPKATRWFITRSRQDDHTALMSGSRVIMTPPTFPYHAVLDFCSPTIHRFRDRSNEPQPGSRDHEILVQGLQGDLNRLANSKLRGYTSITVGVDSPHIIDHESSPAIGFDGPIESRLPYRLAKNGLAGMPRQVLQVTGDCIVGVTLWGPAPDNVTIYKLEQEATSGASLGS